MHKKRGGDVISRVTTLMTVVVAERTDLEEERRYDGPLLYDMGRHRSKRGHNLV